MKEKFAALILCTFLTTASWFGIAKPAQALTLNGTQINWLSGNQSLINALSMLFGQTPAAPPTTDAGSGPATPSNSDNTGSGDNGTTLPPTDNNNPGGGTGTSTPPATDTGSGGTTAPPTTDNNTGGSGTITPPAPDSITGGTGTTTPPPADTNSGGTGTTAPITTAELNYQKYLSHYQSHEVPIVDSFRTNYDGSLAQALVGRAIWYMEHGYMVYGHKKYWDTGYIDCSNFVSLVYKDFGYSITSASRKYTTVGKKVEGVYAKKLSTGKYTLVGVSKLRPGDIFLYWNKDENGLYISHVAIYMGVINGKPAIINTRKEHPTAIGIINSFSYWYGEQLYEVRRVLPDSAFIPNSNVKLSSPVIPAVYQLKPQNPIILPKDLPKGF